ncbi:hypothetical protein Hanom_Chr09g00858621 [Helianthus anomalus]
MKQGCIELKLVRKRIEAPIYTGELPACDRFVFALDTFMTPGSGNILLQLTGVVGLLRFIICPLKGSSLQLVPPGEILFHSSCISI